MAASAVSDSTLPTHLQGLNPPQLQAVQHFKGPILVLAGAGSGKTRVLTRRVAHLVAHHGIAPSKILAVTFTNKATGEMKARLASLLGERSEELWISTFHAAGVKILRRHAARLGYPQDFSIYDDQDSRALLKDVIKFLDFDIKEVSVDHCRRHIDWAKNNYLMAEEYAQDQHHPQYDPDVAQVYSEYQKRLFQAKAMDFGDLLLNCARLLETQIEVRALYQKHLQFILVDEFQDTNKVQYLILRNLVGPEHNLLVVGDDDQSIYGFRGANINNLLQFEADFPETKFVKLEQNYRSTSTILEAAHAVIEKNPDRKDKKLWTESAQGHAICSYLASDESDEASFVVRQISQHLDAGMQLSDFAIFYRIHAQSRALEEALMNAGLPFVIFGGQKFYDRKEIKDIIAYMRLLLNPDDNQAFLRVVNVPARGIGAQTINQLMQEAQATGQSLLAVSANKSSNKKLFAFCELISELQKRAGQVYLSALIEDVLTKTKYLERLKTSKEENAESRIENLRELKAIGRQMESSAVAPLEAMRNFIDRCALSFSDDKPEEEAEFLSGGAAPKRISLMTLHLAKGLEFPVVFLTGMEEGLLPHSRSRLEKLGVAEERRLCYVGMTRAMQKLYLTRTVTRGMFSSGGSFGNSGYFREVSPFLNDIPAQYIDQVNSDEIASYAQNDFNDPSYDQDYSDEQTQDLEDSSESQYSKGGWMRRAPKKKFAKNKNHYLDFVFSAEKLDRED